MITYQDKTFCMSSCTNTQCPRYAHDYIIEGAKEFGLPIAWSNMSVDCPSYVAPEADSDGSVQSEVG